VTGHHLFWLDVQDIGANRPFGIAQESQGRGIIVNIQHFQPNEDPTGTYPLVKSRMFNMLREWIEKGWLDKGELYGAIEGVGQGPPPGPLAPIHATGTAPQPRFKAAPPEKPPKPVKKTPAAKKEKEQLGPVLKPGEELTDEGTVVKAKKTTRTKPQPTKTKEQIEEEQRLADKAEKAKAKPVDFETPLVRGFIPGGLGFYFTDTKGKFIPPDRWKDFPDDITIEAGPKTMTEERFKKYREEVAAKELAAKEEFDQKQAEAKAAAAAAEKARREALAAESKWITWKGKRYMVMSEGATLYNARGEDGVDVVIKRSEAKAAKPPKGAAAPAPAAVTKTTETVTKPPESVIEKPKTVTKPTETVIEKPENVTEPAKSVTKDEDSKTKALKKAKARAAKIKRTAAPFLPPEVEPENDDEVANTSETLQNAIDALIDEGEKSTSIETLEIALESMRQKWPEGRDIKTDIDGLKELEDAIGDYHGSDTNEEYEENFSGVQEAIGNLNYVPPEAAEESEVRENASPGIMADQIPPDKAYISLSEAFKKLKDKGLAKTEAEFKHLLSVELANNQIAGDAGSLGNNPDNSRLRVGKVSGYIKRFGT
jgi:hypothetical protein